LVEEARVLSGHQLLADAAKTAVQSWRYHPYLMNGRPVKVLTTLTIPFEMAPQETEAMHLMENAEQAFRAGNFLDPPGASALDLAKRVQQMEPGNAAAANLEQRVFDAVRNQAQAAAQMRNFDQALSLLNRLMAAFPERSTELASIRENILRGRQEVGVAHFNFQHRHVAFGQNWNMYKAMCIGTLTIRPDGAVQYYCTSTTDPQGRCDRVIFPRGSLTQAKINRDGALHLNVRGQGNYDFYGDPGSVQEAIDKLQPLVAR